MFQSSSAPLKTYNKIEVRCYKCGRIIPIGKGTQKAVPHAPTRIDRSTSMIVWVHKEECLPEELTDYRRYLTEVLDPRD